MKNLFIHLHISGYLPLYHLYECIPPCTHKPQRPRNAPRAGPPMEPQTAPPSEDIRRPAALPEQKQVQLDLLESSFQDLPHPEDGQPKKQYQSKRRYVHRDRNGNALYPQTPQAVTSSPEMFQRYDLDCLFFIFYYQQVGGLWAWDWSWKNCACEERNGYTWFSSFE